MADAAPQREQTNYPTWNSSQFVEAIKSATNGYDIPSSKLPQTIDLTGGKYAQKSDELVRETNNDPRKRERSTYAKLDLTRTKLLLKEQLVVGEETHVSGTTSLRVKKNLYQPAYNSEEYIAILLHSHGVADLPPSPKDLVSLLTTESENPGEAASIVTTPTIRFLLLRTMETQDRTEKEALEVADEHLNKLKQRHQDDGTDYAKKIVGTIGIQNVNKDQLESQVNSWLETQEAKIQMEVLKEVCRENGIAIYTTFGQNNIYHRAL